MSEKPVALQGCREIVSYSEWASEPTIQAYRNSEAHKEIVQHARALKRAKRAVRSGVSKRPP
jgi:heme-degrading monooxygenase HmoA